MTGIIDYGMGNLCSVSSAVEALGEEYMIIDEINDLHYVDKIILPGVGSFIDCYHNLNNKKFIHGLNKAVLENKVPILGICLGMQIMAKVGYEGGKHHGLSWFDAEVIKIDSLDEQLKVPHVGWNNIIVKNTNTLLKNLPMNCNFYFVHSYYMKCNNENDIIATCEYGGNITAAIQKDNIYATQFHPEKSQDYGLKVLENFLSL